MILLLDNFDSFTYNLVDYFAQLGIKCHVERNDVSFSNIKKLNPSALIISPGPEVPSKAGCLMEVLDYYHNRIPILGICLGHQAIGQYFGMNLIKATVPRHGKITTIEHFNDVLFKSIPLQFKVVQYNSLILKKSEKDSSLEIIAISSIESQIMAVRHRDLPIWGVQFHPEAAMTEYGLRLLKNWLDCKELSI